MHRFGACLLLPRFLKQGGGPSSRSFIRGRAASKVGTVKTLYSHSPPPLFKPLGDMTLVTEKIRIMLGVVVLELLLAIAGSKI